MSMLDIFILAPLVIGGLNGLRQGLIKALANLIGWVLALILAAKYATVLSPSMVMLSEDPVVQKIAAFSFIVLVIVVLTWYITACLNSIFKKLKLSWLNRFVGGAFGGLKGLMVILILLQAVAPWVHESPTWKQSQLIQVLLPYAPWAMQLSKDAANTALEHIQSDRPSKQITPSVQTNDGTENNPFY